MSEYKLQNPLVTKPTNEAVAEYIRAKLNEIKVTAGARQRVLDAEKELNCHMEISEFMVIEVDGVVYSFQFDVDDGKYHQFYRAQNLGKVGGDNE